MIIRNNNIIRYITAVFLVVFLLANSYGQETISVEENDSQAQAYLDQGNKAEAARLYTQSAFYYRNNNQLNKAIEYYLKVLQLNKELNNRVGEMLTHSNLSMLYIEAEQFDKALEQLKEELKFREQNKKPNEILPVLLTIASVEVELSAYADAEGSTEKAIELAKELNDLKLLKRAYGVAFDIYTKSGNQDKAQDYFDMYSAIDKKVKEEQMARVKNEADQQVSAANTQKARAEEQLQETSEELEKTVVTLQETERIKREQEMALDLQQAQINEANALLHIERLRKRFWAIGFIVAILFILALIILVLKIRSANKKIEAQKLEIEKQHKEIRSSITYAETIQQATLPDLSVLNGFGDSFVMYWPKDIVSGDFYWCVKESDTRLFFAVVDCTGHGVPGAFMSMVGIRILSEIVQELKIESPAAILNNLNLMVRETLRQEQTDNNDGMDLGIVRLDKQTDGTTQVTFSGAKRPMYIGRGDTANLETLKPDRKSIGGNQPAKKGVEFTDQTAVLKPGDEIFLFSDGITDQNNQNRKKFGRARLENVLSSCIKDDADRQKLLIEKTLKDFMLEEYQRDDITLAGIKIK